MSEGEGKEAGEGKERFDNWRLTQRGCRRPNRVQPDSWMAARTMALLMEPFSRDTIQGLSASAAIFQEGSGEWGSVLGPAAVVLSLTCAPAPEGSFRKPEHTLPCRLLSTDHHCHFYDWQLKGLDYGFNSGFLVEMGFELLNVHSVAKSLKQWDTLATYVSKHDNKKYHN